MPPILLTPALVLASIVLPGFADALEARSPTPLTFEEGHGSVITIGDWIPQSGDRLLINVEGNVGTIVHTSGDRLTFPVISGQRRTLHYLGRRYFGATPQKEWVVKALDIQGDRVTYGRSGRFLRLYDQGTRTHYGIHGHRDEEVMFGRPDRFQSMGCVIVREEVMDLLIKAFAVNEGEIAVVTHGGNVQPRHDHTVVVGGGGQEVD